MADHAYKTRINWIALFESGQMRLKSSSDSTYTLRSLLRIQDLTKLLTVQQGRVSMNLKGNGRQDSGLRLQVT